MPASIVPRLLPLAAGTLAGALTILVTLSFNRSAGGFVTPLIAAYGLGFLWTSSVRTNRVRAMAALALGLLGLVALFPEREVAQRVNHVSVRWTSGLPEAERVALERQFSLTAAEPNSNYSQDVNVWNYDLIDVSAGNIKALVNHPRVVDTNDIDRSNFTVRARPPKTTIRMLESPVSHGSSTRVFCCLWRQRHPYGRLASSCRRFSHRLRGAVLLRRFSRRWMRLSTGARFRSCCS